MRSSHSRHHLMRHYGRENPLSYGEKVGLAAVGLAIAGTIGYFVYEAMYTIAFIPADFTVTGATAPSATVGTSVALVRSASGGTSTNSSGQTVVKGTITATGTASTGGPIVTVKITTGDGIAGSQYTPGMSITGVPVSYLTTP